jgi:hypothetical protein
MPSVYHRLGSVVDSKLGEQVQHIEDVQDGYALDARVHLEVLRRNRTIDTRAEVSSSKFPVTGLYGQVNAVRAQTQRCQKHAKANACRRVRVKEREQFSKDLNRVFYAPSESAARVAFFGFKEQWGRLFPSAVQIIDKDLDCLWTFLQFDSTYWTTLRTTNPIERLNKEFKRRTRAMEVTGGEISNLWLFGVCSSNDGVPLEFSSRLSMVSCLHTNCRLTTAAENGS